MTGAQSAARQLDDVNQSDWEKRLAKISKQQQFTQK
jgi:hypothetical protein